MHNYRTLILIKILIIIQGATISFAQNQLTPILLHIAFENKVNDWPSSEVSVCIINGNDGTEIECKKTNKDEISFNLNPDFNYRISVAADGCINQIDTLRTKSTDTKIYRKIYLKAYAVRLQLYVSKWPENIALAGCTVTLTDMSDISLQQIMAIDQIVKSNHLGNEFLFGLYRDKEYQIVVAKDGYKTLIEIINTWDKSGTISRALMLQPESLSEKEDTIINHQDIAPLSLYFDHDSPKVISNTPSLDTGYGYLAKLYFLKKEKYRSRALKEQNNTVQVALDAEHDQFFNEKIGNWKTRLESFFNEVLSVLDASRKLEIEIRGYASPQGDQEYNKILCVRRIESVIYQITKYNNGKLKTYVDKGTLTLTPIPFGEDSEFYDKSSGNCLKTASKRRVELAVK